MIARGLQLDWLMRNRDGLPANSDPSDPSYCGPEDRFRTAASVLLLLLQGGHVARIDCQISLVSGAAKSHRQGDEVEKKVSVI